MKSLNRPLLIKPRLPPAGVLKTRASIEGVSSRFGVGCETLDRDLYDPVPVFPQVAQLGARWARLQTGWAKCEREQGVLDFGWLDGQVDALLRLGVQPWFNVSYGNPVYQPQATGYQGSVGVVPLETPEALAAWLNYVRKLVEHFRERVQVYEVWNEPDIAPFWQNLPRSGAEYARLFNPTAGVIKSVLPAARIAALALTGSALNSGGRAFVREFMEHVADRDQIDIITFHSYRFPPDHLYEEDVARLRELLAAWVPRAALWQGESGYPSQSGGTGARAHNDETSEIVQAKWLARHVVCNLGIGMDLVSWYHAVDLVGYRDPTKVNPKGLLRSDASPKPSFHAYRDLCAVFTDGVRPVAREWAAEQPGLTAAHALPEIKAYHFAHPAGTRVTAYWAAGAFDDTTAAREIRLQLPGTVGPVRLLDPLSGRLYRVEGPAVEEAGAFRLPLADYPLLLASGPGLDDVFPRAS